METPLTRVKALLASLPREDQEDLTRFLQDILVSPEEADARHVASLMAEVQGKPTTYTFRSEYVRCGKPACKCRAGERHGPYTYKYWRESGRLRKAYVGRAKRPAGKAGEVQPRDSNAASSIVPAPPPSADR